MLLYSVFILIFLAVFQGFITYIVIIARWHARTRNRNQKGIGYRWSFDLALRPCLVTGHRLSEAVTSTLTQNWLWGDQVADKKEDCLQFH